MDSESLPAVAPAQAPLWGVAPVSAFVSAAEIESQQAAERARKQAELAGPAAPSLLTYLERCKNEAITARDSSGVTERLLEAQRRRKGEHSAEKLAQLTKYKLPNHWVPLTQTKCMHTESWLRDLTMPYGDNAWHAEPTVLPELQDDELKRIADSVMDEALAFMAAAEGTVTDQQIQKVV
jgi:hypothetical protein